MPRWQILVVLLLTFVGSCAPVPAQQLDDECRQVDSAAGVVMTDNKPDRDNGDNSKSVSPQLGVNRELGTAAVSGEGEGEASGLNGVLGAGVGSRLNGIPGEGVGSGLNGIPGAATGSGLNGVAGAATGSGLNRVPEEAGAGHGLRGAPELGSVPFKYVGNSFSCIFHRPSCPFAQCISANHLRFFARRFHATDRGYRPCGYCLPKSWTTVHVVLMSNQSQRAPPEAKP
jgi:hypothetical protein